MECWAFLLWQWKCAKMLYLYYQLILAFCACPPDFFFFAQSHVFSNHLLHIKHSRNVLEKQAGFNICIIKAYTRCAENPNRLWIVAPWMIDLPRKKCYPPTKVSYFSNYVEGNYGFKWLSLNTPIQMKSFLLARVIAEPDPTVFLQEYISRGDRIKKMTVVQSRFSC